MKATNMALILIQKDSTCFFLSNFSPATYLLSIYFKDRPRYMCTNCRSIATSQMLFAKIIKTFSIHYGLTFM